MKKGYEHLLIRLWGPAYASDRRYHEWRMEVEEGRSVGYAKADLEDKLAQLHKESLPHAGNGGW